MLYHLFDWLDQQFALPGAAMFNSITFRSIMSVLLSLLISIIYGKRIINFLKRKQIGESIRDLGLPYQEQKKDTPTMGGFIIVLGILIPTLLLADLSKVYTQLLVLTTIWLTFIGFLDDYLKINKRKKIQEKGVEYKKNNRDGLVGKYKIIGQVGLGIIIGLTMYFNEDVVVDREIIYNQQVSSNNQVQERPNNEIIKIIDGQEKKFVRVSEPITTIPFVKNHEFNYSKLITWMGSWAEPYTWVIYILVITFIITAVSNGANITDGLDGLTAGTSAIIGIGISVFAYASSNYQFAEYLNILYVPGLEEASIFIGAFVGACVGFLWYNTYPAQVFMGDTGSLTLGGLIAVLAIIMRKELLIPLFCGVFLIELLSVILQVSFFKYTKMKYGTGKRIFLMSPLHHHYQKANIPEPKIVVRFWIVSILFVIISVLLLKVR